LARQIARRASQCAKSCAIHPRAPAERAKNSGDDLAGGGRAGAADEERTIQIEPRDHGGDPNMPNVATKTDRAPHKTAQEVVESKEFKHLVARRWKLSMALLALLFVSYYGFILLVATQRDLVTQKIGEVTTLAIPLGIAAIVFAWVLTAFYVAWANKSYDPEVERLKSELKR
jgi:uncharacterized membrane protein (DUF485 family)